MHSYNLFRSKGSESLFCAVPEDCCVPQFLTALHWEFRGRIDDGQEMKPIGFDRNAAAAGARFNGFHLFPDFQRNRV